jgi:hypothetical protein
MLSTRPTRTQLGLPAYRASLLAGPHLTLGRLECARPLRLVRRLPGAKGDPLRPELGRAAGLRSAGEDVRPPRDLEPDEACGDNRRPELCLQQSAGDSALPQVDVALRVIRDGLLHENVAELKPPAGSEGPRHLQQTRKLVGKEVQYAV